MARKKSQAEQVLDYIERFGSISTYEAFRDLGITRLASRIFDLTEQGYDFDREMVTARNRFGDHVNFTRYSLKGDNHEN